MSNTTMTTIGEWFWASLADHDGFGDERLLQKTGGNGTGFLINDENTATQSDTKTFVASLRVFGSVLVAGLSVYCVLRKKIPRTFAVRQWVADIYTPLADDQFGYISWLWKVYSFSNDELRDAIGLDALCFVRMFNMGFRLSCVGVFNSIWLMPIYATAPADETASHIGRDPLSSVTIATLGVGSERFLATVFASYIFFGYCWYTIFKEFRWFIHNRHVWLKKFNVRNYTIWVRNIPEDLKSDRLLLSHFQLLYGRDAVLEAHVSRSVPDLTTMINRRKAVIFKLEHALAELEIHGKRPTQLEVMKMGSGHAEVDAIDACTAELNELNDEIGKAIDKIEAKARPSLSHRYLGASRLQISSLGMSSFDRNKKSNPPPTIDEDEVVDKVPDDEDRLGDSGGNIALDAITTVGTTVGTTVVEVGTVVSRKIKKNAKKRARQVKSVGTKVASKAKNVFVSGEDGAARDAGFVTFKTLSATHGAVQMSQHEEPFVFETDMVPDEPDYIFWHNVGVEKETRNVGILLSAAATGTLCVFWTFVISFIVGLTEVESLRENYSTIDNVLNNAPWMTGVFAVISPLLFLLFNSVLLPIILKAFSRFEKPVADSALEASAFWKMAAFTIIQSFLVTLISGSLLSELSNIARTPGDLVNLMANSLPRMSTYYMQLLNTSTCFASLMELFRVIPLVQSAIRAHLPFRLTEKERCQALYTMKPLCVVDKVYWSRVWTRFLLYFIVLFVYSSIAPLVNFLAFTFFLFVGAVYRYQFVFNYPPTPDSGGAVWLKSMHVLLAILMIAQVVIAGILSLNRATIALPCMIPLVIISALLIIYLWQRHFAIGYNLPARSCLNQDLDNEEVEDVDFSRFKGAYKHTALKVRFLDADWDSGKGERDGKESLKDKIPKFTEEGVMSNSSMDYSQGRKRTSVEDEAPAANGDEGVEEHIDEPLEIEEGRKEN